jgi:hypothetical protein
MADSIKLAVAIIDRVWSILIQRVGFSALYTNWQERYRRNLGAAPLRYATNLKKEQDLKTQ